jgi:hypothetical protein
MAGHWRAVHHRHEGLKSLSTELLRAKIRWEGGPEISGIDFPEQAVQWNREEGLLRRKVDEGRTGRANTMALSSFSMVFSR